MNDIKNLFSGYFHEDWEVDAHEPSEVIANFLAEGCSAEELDGLSSNIRVFVGQYDNDADLEDALFRELGCYYQPSADGVSAKTWLEHVALELAGKSKQSRKG